MADVDYYELLGVRTDATSSEIKSAYRTLARSAHPDAGGTAATFQALREAYETLADPVLRAAYDRARSPAGRRFPSARRGTPAGPGAGPPRPRPHGGHPLGDDPDFVPPSPRVDVTTLPWWHQVGAGTRVHYEHPGSPGHAPAVSTVCGALLLPLPAVVLPFAFSVWLLAVWLLLLTTAATMVVLLVRRHRESLRALRAFRAEFGDRPVFGAPGTEPEQIAERRTAELFEHYLTRLPGVRLFHGLALPGSVFADVDHAVLCGRRLVLVESKRWLPGHYTTDHTGRLCRNDRPFRGGGTTLSDSVAAFRELLPEVRVRGALLLYPSREGEVTAEAPREAADAEPVTPEQFVRYLGDWLAAEPVTVDRHVLRTVLAQVVGEGASTRTS